MAWRNDEPARSALAIRVIVSGQLLVEGVQSAALAASQPEPRDHEPDEAADEQHDRAAERPDERRQEDQEERDADVDAAQIIEELGRLELEVRPGDLAGEVGAEVALLDDAVQVGERDALGDELADRRPARVEPSLSPRPVEA